MNDNSDDFEKRLEKARQDYNEEYNPVPKNNDNMSMGARAGIELVGAILGGGLIGFLLDKFFLTSPILFFVFLFLGIATAFYNVYKITANAGTSVGFAGLKDKEKNAKQSVKNKNESE